MRNYLPILLALLLFATNATGQSSWPASKVLFDDAETLQFKFDEGDLGGGGTPTGSEGQVQFYEAGAFGGAANLIYDATMTNAEWDGSSYHLAVGDADEGLLKIGTSFIGQANDTLSTTVFDDVLLIYNPTDTISDIAYMFVGSSNVPRFVIAEEGASLATYNPRSMVIGPAATLANVDENILCSTNFSVIDCDTGGTGADLGVMDDIELGGSIFAPDGTAGAPTFAFTSDATTGFYLQGANLPAVSIAGVGRYFFTASYFQTKPIRTESGAEATPSYTFLANSDAGLYHSDGGSTIGMTYDSSRKQYWGISASGFTVPIHATDGTIDLPGITWWDDTNTGFYWLSADVFRAVTGGNAKQEWNASSVKMFDNLFLIDGTVGAPALAFSADPDTGIYADGVGDITLVVGGAEILAIQDGGFYPTRAMKMLSFPGDLTTTAYTWSGDVNTGIYQVSDGVVGIGSNGTKVAQFDSTGMPLDYVGNPTGPISWTFGNGENFVATSNQQDAGTAFIFRANRSGGTSNSVDGFVYQLDNEGDGAGTLDGFLVQVLNSSTNQGINTAFEIAHGEDVGALHAGLMIRGTSTGAVNTAVLVNDPEIVDAINIGDNIFATTSTDIAAASFDRVFNPTTLLLEDGVADGVPGIAFESDTTTGWYRPAADQWAFRVGGTSNVMTMKLGMFTHNSGTRIANGSLSQPSLAFNANTNTGLYQAVSGDDSIGFVTDGSEAGYFDVLNDFYVTNDIAAGGRVAVGVIGSAADTAIHGQWPGAGIEFPNANSVAISADSARIIDFTKSYVFAQQPIYVYGLVSLEATPGFTFYPDTNTGIFQSTDDTDVVSFSTGGTLAGEFDANNDLTVVADVDVGEDIRIAGAILPTMLTLDATTTPDVSAGSVFKTGTASLYITNFDGAEPVGKLLYIHIAHSDTVFACGSNFYCGAARTESIYTSVGDTIVWQRGPGYWRLISSTGTAFELDATVNWLGDQIAVGNDLVAVSIPGSGNGKITEMVCVADGADADLVVSVDDCNGALTACGATGLSVNVLNDNVSYTDYNAGSDDTSQAGNWWRFTIDTVTIQPDMLTCSIKYTVY